MDLPPQTTNSSTLPSGQPSLTPEQTARIQEILAHPTGDATNPPKKSSTGWAIFWLIAFTPVGWYYVVKKTSWPAWLKITVILVSITAFVGLAIETELVAYQVTSALGGVDSNLPGLAF